MLEKIKPVRVFEHFESLTKIPHGSGNEKAISDYLVSFANNLDLQVVQDEALNVIIRKPASLGYEMIKPLILQGHIDMVCEKNRETAHDFLKDALPIHIDGDFLKSKGTTLGADNGIAIAYMMAILEDFSLKHPAITCIMTTGEEDGMGGAIALSPEQLDADTIINIDSEEEGVVLLSCAGGVRNRLHLPIQTDIKKNLEVLFVEIRGLKGGHSGMDINKNRENANKLLGKFLMMLQKKQSFQLATIQGGSKMNAIPREASATLYGEDVKQLEEFAKEISLKMQQEIVIGEEQIEFCISSTKLSELEVFTVESSKRVLQVIQLIPNGVQTMSILMDDMVESSTNLGIISTHLDRGQVIFESAIRSSSEMKKNWIQESFSAIADIVGGSSKFTSDYPAWPLAKESKIKDLFQKTYFSLYQKELQSSGIHAGLECGIFAGKKDGLDMISFGPNMFDVHSPDERLSISSTERMYNFLISVLENCKNESR